MLHKLSIMLSEYLIKISSYEVDAEQQEVYIYGFECFLNTTITIFILFLWGVITHTLLETVIWLISFTFLRHYSGGYHAPTNFLCITSSVLLGLFNYFICDIQLNSFTYLWIYLALILLCLFLAPVKNHNNKAITKPDIYYKSIAVITLTIAYLIHFFLSGTLVVHYTYGFVGCVLLMLVDVLHDLVK